MKTLLSERKHHYQKPCPAHALQEKLENTKILATIWTYRELFQIKISKIQAAIKFSSSIA